MEFWKWYFSKIKSAILLRWVITPCAEWIFGVFLFVFSSIYLSIFLSPFWLLATVPVGVTVAVHGLYRGLEN